MPQATTISDEPIWNESTLIDMVRDTGRSAQTRSWALETLARLQGPKGMSGLQAKQALVSLVVDMLDDEEPNLAAHALTMLEEADGAECSQAVANFARRDDVPLWSRLLATVLLASCGNKDATRRALHEEKARMYFAMWADRDPQGFADAACEAWSEELAGDIDFLHACTVAAKPELAWPLLRAIASLDPDDDDRADLMLTAMAHAGFGMPELCEDMPIVWHPRDEDIFASRVDKELLEARCEAVGELVANSAWAEVTEHCLETIGLLAEMGAKTMKVPSLEWALALSHALGELPRRTDDDADFVTEAHLAAEDYQRAQLAFALQEAVLLVFDIEATLEARDGLDVALALHGWSIGAERDRLEDVIRQRWEPCDTHREAITGWLAALDDEFEWFDALGVASRLPGYNISPCLLALVSEMEDERAGYDIDWAAETLLEVLESKPRAIAVDPERLLLGKALVSDSTLQALRAQPYCWASDLILEYFDRLVGTEENEILWETVAELSDPRSLDLLVEHWRATENTPRERGLGEYRLAHAIGFVADVTGRLDELPEGVLRELDELSRVERRYQKRLEALIDGTDDLAAALPDADFLELELKCRACDAVDRYCFDELYLDHERGVDIDAPFEAILPDRVIECTQCQACDQVEATERSQRTLTAMLTALNRAEQWPEDAPIQVWHPELWDGTTFRSALEGINRLKAQAEAQPDQPEPWRRLGHFCTRFHADSEAKHAYEHAHSLDGKGVPEPNELREVGIPTAPLAPAEAARLLSAKQYLGEERSEMSEVSAHSRQDQAHRDQTQQDQAQPDQAQPDQAQPDQAQPDQAQPDQAQQDQTLHECLVSERWRDVEGLCTVFVSRKASGDRLLAAAFLVDLGCQGVKDVIFATTLDADKYQDLKQRLEGIHGTLVACAPELAANILETAVRFSLALGFFPPDGYFNARTMLDGYAADACEEDVPIGEAGLPLYVGDPDANEPVIERLYRRTGPDGFASL